MGNEEAEVWAERLWRLSMATQLDSEHRALAAALVEKVVDDAEQAAFLIAVLVQLGKDGHD